MNDTEAEYAAALEGRRTLGQIEWWAFGAVSLRLADGASYRPDFLVMLTTGLIECHEVKGYWTADSRVRIKVAATLYPFRFVAIRRRLKRDGGGWSEEEF